MRVRHYHKWEWLMKCKTIAVYCVALAFALAAAKALADSVSDFYKGKSINLLIMSPPGGGYDAYSRLLARHFGKFIPGNPTIVPQNMVGAGGLKLANYLYYSAAHDGLTLGMFGAFVGLEPLFGNDDATFETVKFTWIGNMNRDVEGCTVWSASGFNTIADARQRQITFGSSGRASTTSQHALVLKNMLGVKAKVIEGYGGANDIVLAMRRGEVDASCGVYLSSVLTTYGRDLTSGEMKVLIQFGRKNVPVFGAAENIYDLLQTDEERQIADVIFRQSEIGRPVAAPPGIPDDRAIALRSAFLATLKDPAFLADAEKIGLPIDAMSGEDIDQLFETFYAAPKSIIEQAKNAMNRE
jgi:tripartite-type tricarboxylate transporter receptor subunit TctC